MASKIQLLLLVRVLALYNHLSWHSCLSLASTRFGLGLGLEHAGLEPIPDLNWMNYSVQVSCVTSVAVYTLQTQLNWTEIFSSFPSLSTPCGCCRAVERIISCSPAELVNSRTPDEGSTALHFACRSGYRDIAALLIEQVHTWLNGLVVNALGIRPRWPRFESRIAPLFDWVATLGNLFTHTASPVSQLQKTGVQKFSAPKWLWWLSALD